MRAEQDQDAAATIRSCLELARAVGLTVVAEGIQNESTLRWLAMHGCHQGQGYHISPPLFAAEFGAWLEARHAAGEPVPALRAAAGAML
jgi:EAL domain-containing protein (putative c-di-GMP-specific phosphodiesterase class I)